MLHGHGEQPLHGQAVLQRGELVWEWMGNPMVLARFGVYPSSVVLSRVPFLRELDAPLLFSHTLFLRSGFEAVATGAEEVGRGGQGGGRRVSSPQREEPRVFCQLGYADGDIAGAEASTWGSPDDLFPRVGGGKGGGAEGGG